VLFLVSERGGGGEEVMLVRRGGGGRGGVMIGGGRGDESVGVGGVVLVRDVRVLRSRSLRGVVRLRKTCGS